MLIVDQFLLDKLKDPRDLVGARLMLCLGIAAPLGAVAMYVPGVRSPWTVAAYYLLIFGMMDRFIPGMHMHYHRVWFKSRLANGFMPNFVGLFFGQSFLTYLAHHNYMHHVEDNGPGDLSTTRPFQRDNIVHLAFYLLSFILTGIPQLIVYFVRKGQSKLARRVIIGEGSTWILLWLLSTIDAWSTFLVFVVPMVVARFMMMLANWGQHSFLPKPEHEGRFMRGGTLLNSEYNRRCFNIGYHGVHHIRPGLHWSRLPAEFARQRGEFEAEGGFFFERVPTFQFLSIALVLHRYAWLERRLVRYEGDQRTAAERIEWMRSMLGPQPEVLERQPL